MTIPPDFHVPEHLRPQVAAIRERYSLTGDAIAADLLALGLPSGQAETVAVDILVHYACEIAIMVAWAQERDPSRERWQAVTGEAFDRALSFYQSAIDQLRAGL